MRKKVDISTDLEASEKAFVLIRRMNHIKI